MTASMEIAESQTLSLDDSQTDEGEEKARRGRLPSFAGSDSVVEETFRPHLGQKLGDLHYSTTSMKASDQNVDMLTSEKWQAIFKDLNDKLGTYAVAGSQFKRVFTTLVLEMSRPTAFDCLRARWILDNGDCVLSEEEIRAVTVALTTWKEKNPWQKAMCLKLAVGCTCINTFSRVFSRFDTDQSGALNRSEVMAALQSLGIDKNASKKISQDLDVNGDNSCEYLEFAAACLSSLEDKFDEMLRLQFMKLDSNHDGVVSADEFQGLVDELTPVAMEHGFSLLRADLDQNNDGLISFNEFATYFGRKGINYDSSKFIVALPCKEYITISRKDSLETLKVPSLDSDAKVEGNVPSLDSGAKVKREPETSPALDSEKPTKKKTRKKKKQSRSRSEQNGRRKSVSSLEEPSKAATATDRILWRLQKRRGDTSCSEDSRSIASTSETESDSGSESTSTAPSSPSSNSRQHRARNEYASFDFSDVIEKIERSLTEKDSDAPSRKPSGIVSL